MAAPACEPVRIAVLRLGALGDAVLTHSLLRSLRQSGHEVTLVTARSLAPVVQEMEDLRRVVFYKRDVHAGWTGLRDLAREVGAVDLVLDLQNKPRTFLLSRLISTRGRRALRLRGPLGSVRALLGHGEVFDGFHQTELLHEMVSDLVTSAEPPQPLLKLRKRGDARYVTLVPGAGHATKRWPVERFAQLVQALRIEGVEVAVVAGPGEEELYDSVVGSVRGVAGVRGGGLGALLDMLVDSKLVVAGDSGPGHLASAMGVPVISLFGPTSERRWRPLGRGRVIALELSCRPCSNFGQERCPLSHHRCLGDIEIREVLGAVREVLVGEAP